MESVGIHVSNHESYLDSVFFFYELFPKFVASSPITFDPFYLNMQVDTEMSCLKQGDNRDW
ncbi:hypothetical protein HanRHA438_Chr06g0282681 [Helianthus annuus]|nr:hypothetical protein HanRHA438_Chr06g0282681 [Helianthus annuus]